MNIKVVYHSSTGNTKKLAEAIAGALGVTAEQTEKEPRRFSEPVDLLFIGDGIYAGKPSKSTLALIDKLTPETVKNAAVFGTYGGQDKIGRDIQRLLKGRGLNVVGEPYVCKGQSWFFMNRKHPNESELSGARSFAREAASKI